MAILHVMVHGEGNWQGKHFWLPKSVQGTKIKFYAQQYSLYHLLITLANRKFIAMK